VFVGGNADHLTGPRLYCCGKLLLTSLFFFDAAYAPLPIEHPRRATRAQRLGHPFSKTGRHTGLQHELSMCDEKYVDNKRAGTNDKVTDDPGMFDVLF
jgi:hypothetical protein